MKVEGAITVGNPTVIDGKSIQIFADPSSTLTCTKAGVTLDIKNTNADVSIYDLEITKGMGSKTDATVSLSGSGTPKLSLTRVKIDSNQGIGIVTTSGILTVSRSIITTNDGGGISITGGQFDLTNNFIVSNGGIASTLGGVLLKQSDNGVRQFEFNTVANNFANTNITSGVLCSSLTQDVTFSNNIVFNNAIIGTAFQVDGMHCNWTFSDISQSVPGTGNLNVDPMFVDPNNVDPLQRNYHLTPQSMVIDQGNTDPAIKIDFDGNSRPQGAKSDIGADEVPPPQ